jgi:hypothetical protein
VYWFSGICSAESIFCQDRPGASVGDEEERDRVPAALVGLRAAGDDEHGVGLVDARGPVLLPAQPPAAAVVGTDAVGGGGDVVGVGTGVGLGDGEADLLGAVGDAGQPLPLLLLRPVSHHHRARDGRRDHQHEHRAALAGGLLDDEREVFETAATAAELLGQMHPEEPVPAHVRPQRVGLLALARDVLEVLASVAAHELADRVAQGAALVGLGEQRVAHLSVGHIASWSNQLSR